MISNELKATIQGAYSRFLEAKSLKPRYGQRLMIAEVAKVLGDIACDDEGRRAGEPAVVAEQLPFWRLSHSMPKGQADPGKL